MQNNNLWIGKLIVFFVLAYGTLWNKGYAVRRMLRLDRWINFNLLNGLKGETISRRGGRVIARRALGIRENGDAVWCVLCKLLDLFDRDHCIDAYRDYTNNANLPKE